MGHSSFRDVFRSGARFQERSILYTIEVEPTGEVTTQGRLRVFDPVPDELGGFGRDVFARDVPAGTFRVEAAFARNEKHPDNLVVAAVRLLLGAGPATRWEPAIRGTEDTPCWGEDPSLRVLSGLLAVGAESAHNLWCEPPEEKDSWFTLEHEDGSSAVVFDVGEGSYSAYWGFDAEGALVELCVDTKLLTRAVWSDVRLPLPLEPAGLERANASFGVAGVRASAEAPQVLRLDGDVRRIWFARIEDSAGKEIGAFQPRLSGSGETFSQRYDCAPYAPHGAAVVRIRMVLPDEALEPQPNEPVGGT